MAGHFRFSVWDPLLIISQIITMQCIFYVSLGLWICLMDVFSNTEQSLDQIFTYQEVQIKEMRGRLIITAFVLNSLTCSVGLWYVIQRTKQCLDYTLTMHVIHLVACFVINGLTPPTLAWWLLMLICITVMCVCGEFLCMRTELKAIPVSLGPKADL